MTIETAALCLLRRRASDADGYWDNMTGCFNDPAGSHTTYGLGSLHYYYTFEFQSTTLSYKPSFSAASLRRPLSIHSLPRSLSREVKRSKKLLESLTLPLLLRLTLPTILPVRPLLQTQQLAQHASSKLQIKPERRVERKHHFLLQAFRPDHHFEVVPSLRRCNVAGARGEFRRVGRILGLDGEAGFHEASGDELGRDRKKLPVRVHAAATRVFPRDGAQTRAVGGGVFAEGCEHGVQAGAVLLHFGFDIGPRGGVVYAGYGGDVGDGDDEDMAWEGRAEVREGCEGGEGAFGGGEVGVFADGADHVRFALRVGEAEVALSWVGRACLLSAFAAVAAAGFVGGGEAHGVEGVLLGVEGFALTR